MEPTLDTSYSDQFFGQSALPTVSAIDIQVFIPVLFLIVLLIWLLYSGVIVYHWTKYSYKSWVAVPALGTHFAVSLVCILYMATGLL